jgi:hypothetical protein
MLTREEAISAINRDVCRHNVGSICGVCKDEIRAMILKQQPEQPRRKPINSSISLTNDNTVVITTCDDGTQWLLRSISENSLLEGYEKLPPIPQDDENAN